MAKINKNGTLSGKVGNVVYCTWKGIPYQRSAPVIINPSRTPAQLSHRAKFALVTHALKPMADLFKITFKRLATDKTTFNVAYSLAFKNAVSGKYPDYYIDFKNVPLSRGRLPNIESPLAFRSYENRISFSWDSNDGTGDASAEDRAILVVYCEEMRQCIFKKKGAARKTGNDSLKVPDFSSMTVHTWIIFMSANGKEVSDSLYTGALRYK